MEDKNITCCFSGHRSIPSSEITTVAARLAREIERLVFAGCRRFCAGGAVGFDTLAAEAVLRLRVRVPDIKLILMLPCRDQAAKWSARDREKYASLIKRADEVIYAAESYTPDCFFLRDRMLVDASGSCICYLTRESGGTYYTVNYARRQGLTVINTAEE